MKRFTFFSRVTGVISLLTIPAHMFAAATSWFRDDKGFKVDADTDRHGNVLKPFAGDRFFCKVSGRDCNGDSYIFESTREEEGGPLLHTHFEQDEWWYVLKGQFLIKVGSATYEAGPGDFVYGPRMVPHTFSKVGTGIGKLLIGFHPAGKMQEYFEKLSRGEAKNLTDQQREAMRKEHGFESSGPALTVLKK